MYNGFSSEITLSCFHFVLLLCCVLEMNRKYLFDKAYFVDKNYVLRKLVNHSKHNIVINSKLIAILADMTILHPTCKNPANTQVKCSFLFLFGSLVALSWPHNHLKLHVFCSCKQKAL